MTTLTISKWIGNFGKICVPMFAFCSGYALWVNRKIFSSYRNIMKRGSKFLAQYWIIYLFFLIFGLATGDEMPDATNLILNQFGYRTTMFESHINVVFAWYVTFYLFWLAYAPLTIKLATLRKNVIEDLAIIIIAGLIISYMTYTFGSINCLDIFNSSLVGVFFAKFKYMTKI